MGTVLRAAGRERGSGWTVLVAAGAVIAMALAGCAGAGGSQSAAGGASAAGGSSSASPPAVSALVPTSQLAAVGTIVAPGFPGTGAVATAGQAAPSKASWFTSDLIVYPSQDYRAAIAIYGQAAGDISAVTVNPDGTQTTLDNVASSASNPIFSGDGKWLAYLPSPSSGSSLTQVYHLSGTSAQPITFRVPSQVSAGGAETAVLGFTASDQLLVDSNGEQLWAVSPDGSTARQYAASLPLSISLAADSAIVDEVTGTPQAGDVAVSATPLNGNQDTMLLSPSGTVLHTFPGATPMAFGPDGRYLLIQIGQVGTASANAGEVCDIVTYRCVPTPSGNIGPWLPNNDLVATLNGNPLSWWNPATGKADTVPPVFEKYPGLNLVLPAALMNRVATVKDPGGP